MERFAPGGATYDIAVYNAGFPANSVSPRNGCDPMATGNSCLARSIPISPTLHFAWVYFTPILPNDDFSGPARYDYFDEYHPTVGHGTIIVYKSPDMNMRGSVDIVDAATLALAFDSNHLSGPNWIAAADLNNDGTTDLMDASILALYFGQPI